jgi:hypothetical protein
MSTTIFATDYVINLQVLIIATVPTDTTITLKHTLFMRPVASAVQLV